MSPKGDRKVGADRPKEAKPELIRAVAYVRKSSKGERRDGRQKQEKSIPQQKAESAKLANGRFEIVKWFEDEGISGWKRGAKRPDFQRMLTEVKSLKAQAIICDNIDRFSRATVDEVQIDANELRMAGVRWIVTASHGTYDLGKRHDIGEILKFVVAVWSANEYSRQLSRRVTLARRNAASEGRRTGGGAAYGLANDGKGGLKHGDPQESKIVQWMFDYFTNRLWSMNRIAGELNTRGVAAPRGGKWSCKTITAMLRNRAYRGDFTFNNIHAGHFYAIDGKGEVVEASETNGDRKLFISKGRYKPLVAPAVFDKAQRRLATLRTSRSRRRQSYALSGILFCDHCGCAMAGRRPRGRETTYHCSGNNIKGLGACEYYMVRESDILPVVMRLLGEEIKHVEKMLSAPPDELRFPNRERAERRKVCERERERLAAQIAKAEENLLFSDDARTRKSLDARVSAMRDELERLDAELGEKEPIGNGYTREDLDALSKWWAEFDKRAVSVPLPGKHHPVVGLYQDLESEEQAVLLDNRVVNEALHELGAEVRLRWRTEKYKGTGGVERQRHVLVRGRFRLGQRKGNLPILSVTSGQAFFYARGQRRGSPALRTGPLRDRRRPAVPWQFALFAPISRVRKSARLRDAATTAPVWMTRLARFSGRGARGRGNREKNASRVERPSP